MFAIRASKAGKRARKTRGEAQTSFMRGRREFGGVRNVCDKSFQSGQKSKKTRCEAQTSFMRGRREFGGVRNVCDVCIV